MGRRQFVICTLTGYGCVSRTTFITFPTQYHTLDRNRNNRPRYWVYIVLLSRRPATLLPLTGYIWLAFPAWTAHIPQTVWAYFFGATSICYLLHFIDVALLSKWSFETNGPISLAPRGRNAGRDTGDGTREGQTGTVWEQLRFGLIATFSHRNIGTPYEVKNVPLFLLEIQVMCPLRVKFLLSTVRKMVFCYLVLDILTSPRSQPEKNEILFSSRAVPFLTRLSELSIEEVAVRMLSTFIFWISGQCFLQPAYSAAAAAAVGLSLNEPKSWRPNFGPLIEAYTIRQFWR